MEFREDTEDSFFSAITMGLDVNAVQFKLAPTYTIYMATRFRASTHYRPELIPEERAIRLTAMLDAVSDCIFGKFGYFLTLFGTFLKCLGSFSKGATRFRVCILLYRLN